MPANVWQWAFLILLPRGGFCFFLCLVGLLVGSRAVGGHGLCKSLHPILILFCQWAGRLGDGPGAVFEEPNNVPGVWVHDVEDAAIGLYVVVVLAQAGKVCGSRRPAIRVVDAVILLAHRGRAVAAWVVKSV